MENLYKESGQEEGKRKVAVVWQMVPVAEVGNGGGETGYRVRGSVSDL